MNPVLWGAVLAAFIGIAVGELVRRVVVDPDRFPRRLELRYPRVVGFFLALFGFVAGFFFMLFSVVMQSGGEEFMVIPMVATLIGLAVWYLSVWIDAWLYRRRVRRSA